jgi:hypothetical protein
VDLQEDFTVLLNAARAHPGEMQTHPEYVTIRGDTAGLSHINDAGGDDYLYRTAPLSQGTSTL